MQEQDRLVAGAAASPNEENVDRALRPTVLRDYVGQEAIREQLHIFIAAARRRGEPLDHLLLFGPPVLGKTTLAHIVAHEMGVNLRQTSGPVLERPGDLAAILTNLEKHDILFICDEVQAGLCRTGTFWAFQQHGLTPDAISMAKSLANGLPMGAMLATDEMAKGFEAGSHATTFGGGALASGVAAKCVEIMLRDKLADRAAELGKHVMDRVRAIQDKLPGTVREVRGLGLMIGIELAVDAAAVWRELIARGFICNLSHGVTLRLLPALTIDKADLDAFIDTLEDILRTAK